MISQRTLLDLARQRLATITTSPSFTRPAREEALRMLREVEARLRAC